MNRPFDGPFGAERGPLASRRAVLAGTVGAAAVAGGGCLQRARSVVNRSGPTPISLSIKTAPTDYDPRSIRIARFLARKLETVGVHADVTPMDQEELLRDVLVNQSFQVYVARYPTTHDPDFLRPLLHSRFGSEAGWQNPFGYANLQVDRFLERQRDQTGAARVETLRRLQRTVASDCPFAVVAFPDDIRAVRTDRVGGWNAAPLHTLQSYLLLEARDGESAAGNRPSTTTAGPSDRSDLRMTLADVRATKNLNPLSVEFRDGGSITDLLYDPLARWVGGTLVPWLAASWEWRHDDAGGTIAEVVLRDDLTWHDGEPLTAADVSFTYDLLADTSLGDMEIPVPAPRFRGRSSLVASAQAVDDRTVRFDFADGGRQTATLAFSVPVLPEHVWSSRTSAATVANLGDGSATEALVAGNMNPIGSGPLEYASSTVNEHLALAPFADHFLSRAPLEEPLSRYAGGFSFDRLVFRVVPSGDAAVALLQSGEADGTASGVTPADVPRVGHSDRTRLHVERSTAFYHVGFNVRSSPLSNTRFRRAVAGLLDKGHLVNDVLDNYGRPATSPLAPYDAVAPQLVWDGHDAELPFPGANGTLDVSAARQPFLDAGYRYREDGGVLVS